MECEKKAADERVKHAEARDVTLEEREREHSAQLAEVRDKESQHRATTAQMRYGVAALKTLRVFKCLILWVLFCFGVKPKILKRLNLVGVRVFMGFKLVECSLLDTVYIK